MLINERSTPRTRHSLDGREREPTERTEALVPDARRLKAWVEELSLPRHAIEERANNRRVQKRLCEALEDCGLAVRVQGPFGNVLAMPKDASRRPVTLVAAHYDTVPRSPGADDNGSGLAVLLECARLLHACDVPVGFVCFNAEEDGLLGSRDFVANALPTLDRSVRAVHVLEMVGYRRSDRASQSAPLPWLPRSLRTPDFIALIGRGASNRIVDAVRASTASPNTRVVTGRTFNVTEKLIPDLRRSDHAPFWDKGIPAVLWTDTGDFRNPHYHRPSDTAETLDYAFMQGVGALLATALRRPSG
jgi:Zn-dependent M28 family amino/carboxypeptidase